MTDHRDKAWLAGPGMMTISAVLFGYFGFFTAWNTTGVNGQFLLFVAVLEWTLKGSAILFVLSAALTLIKPLLGNAIYSLTGLLGALGFILVIILDLLDARHTAMSPVILGIFAVWNGWGSWQSLRAIIAMGDRPRERFELPGE